MSNLKPGKGVRLPFQPMLPYVLEELDKLERIADEFEGDARMFMTGLQENGWEFYSDKFGDVCYIEEQIDSVNTFRISVVLDPKGNLKLDFRNWYVG